MLKLRSHLNQTTSDCLGFIMFSLMDQELRLVLSISFCTWEHSSPTTISGSHPSQSLNSSTHPYQSEINVSPWTRDVFSCLILNRVPENKSASTSEITLQSLMGIFVVTSHPGLCFQINWDLPKNTMNWKSQVSVGEWHATRMCCKPHRCGLFSNTSIVYWGITESLWSKSCRSPGTCKPPAALLMEVSC